MNLFLLFNEFSSNYVIEMLTKVDVSHRFSLKNGLM